jgi:hypothetical protein
VDYEIFWDSLATDLTTALAWPVTRGQGYARLLGGKDGPRITLQAQPGNGWLLK